MSEKIRSRLNTKEERRNKKREWKKRTREKKIEERRRKKMWRDIEGSPLESVPKEDGKDTEIHVGEIHTCNSEPVAKCQNVTVQPNQTIAETDVIALPASNPEPNQELLRRELKKTVSRGKIIISNVANRVTLG